MKIEWKYISKGELPFHGKPVRVVRKNGYVGVDNYSPILKIWIHYSDVIIWHDLLDIPKSIQDEI